MIVTCPSCNAKYRVRDDAVPHAGAQLKCPECDTLFLAHRPAHNDRELTDAIDRLTKQNHEAEARIRDLEKRVKDVTSDADRQKAEFRRLNEEAGRALASRDREMGDLKAELARAREERGQSDARAEQLRAYDTKVQQLARELQAAQDELERVKLTSASTAEVAELKDALVSAQKVSGRLTNELDASRGVIAHLQEELQRVRQQQATGGGGPAPAALLTLIGAVNPMLWGLDQTIRYLEPFASNEPTLANHVRQLQLLAGVLKRLAEATGSAPERL